jgi:hypothetical protein
MTHPHRAPELRPPCAPGTLARPTRAVAPDRERSGLVGRHLGERQRETLDKDRERDAEMPKMLFVALQIFHTVLPGRSKPSGHHGLVRIADAVPKGIPVLAIIARKVEDSGKHLMEGFCQASVPDVETQRVRLEGAFHVSLTSWG